MSTGLREISQCLEKADTSRRENGTHKVNNWRTALRRFANQTASQLLTLQQVSQLHVYLACLNTLKGASVRIAKICEIPVTSLVDTLYYDKDSILAT